MRTLKFRAKDKHTGEWIYSTGFLQHSTGVITMIVKETEDGFVTSPIDLETFGQFTGLTDKNGAEIYEGDLLQFKQYIGGNHVEHHYENLYVVWNDRNANFNFRSIDNIGGRQPFSSYEGHELTITGNIHDKPKEDAGV